MRCVLLLAAFLGATAFTSPRAARPTARHSMAYVTEEARRLLGQEALYDLVYVERLPPPTTTASGFVLVAPKDPPMHLARIITFGTGQEGENGVVTANSGIKKGDLVYVKFPWGIGPKDEEIGEEGSTRRFSFLRYSDIAAVVASA
ncbi:hypothetical protein M885DRAFT_539491 [Pelagophyceae sp. CCMP2097]|nr:hypothetical protein M885DRAFT_539491 [Pelagophyceae sp. CCMP2097]